MDPKLNLALKLLRECFNGQGTNLSSVKIDFKKNECEIVSDSLTNRFKISMPEMSETSEENMSNMDNNMMSATSDRPMGNMSNMDNMCNMGNMGNMDNMDNMSATSPIETENQMSKELMPGLIHKGGNNIFKTLKYSDTSSIMYSDLLNSSNTSQNTFTPRNNKYSETSSMEQLGGKNSFKTAKYSETSPMEVLRGKHIFKTAKYSETSPMEQLGGKSDSDTLNSISELKDIRANSKKSNLNVDIFKKTQSGGSNNKQNLTKKIMELGINSSSTSSVCE